MSGDILQTPGSIELATNLYLLGDGWNEDIPKRYESILTCLVLSSPFSVKHISDVILKVVNWKPDIITKISISRLHSAIQASQLDQARIRSPLELMYVLGMSETVFYLAFLDAGLFPCCITLARKGCKMAQNIDLESDIGERLLSIICTAFSCLSVRLAHSRWPWIIQAIEAGVLSAVADVAVHLPLITAGFRDQILDIIRTTLPRNLVYRSVVLRMKEEFNLLDDCVIRGSILEESWDNLKHRCLGIWMVLSDTLPTAIRVGYHRSNTKVSPLLLILKVHRVLTIACPCLLVR